MKGRLTIAPPPGIHDPKEAGEVVGQRLSALGMEVGITPAVLTYLQRAPSDAIRVFLSSAFKSYLRCEIRRATEELLRSLGR